MRFHIIEKLSQNFDFVTTLMILTFQILPRQTSTEKSIIHSRT